MSPELQDSAVWQDSGRHTAGVALWAQIQARGCQNDQRFWVPGTPKRPYFHKFPAQHSQKIRSFGGVSNWLLQTRPPPVVNLV